MKLDINKFPGSKGASGIYQWIINHIPKCSYFIEGFGGSAEITFKLIGEKSSIGCYMVYEKSQQVVDQLRIKFNHYQTANCFIKTEDFLKSPIYKVGNVVFYFDPPYTFSSRRSSRKIYEYEWNNDIHKEFIERVLIEHGLGNKIIISHYDDPLYNEMLKGWHTSTKNAMTRGGVSEEKIYMNYDINDYELATTNFLGEDYVDRQRIKRKVERMVNKFERLHPHERQAILEKIKK